MRSKQRRIYRTKRTFSGSVQNSDYKPHTHTWVEKRVTAGGNVIVIDHCTGCGAEDARDLITPEEA